ncbi:hypothetical protein DEU56DRAFT_919566 [Suillus clintonianus]|uniref:uncharacterized protein n=1 Tax=Suillus clintonianus TaxID=1904413 RepID=UPI001B8867C0|nr:uncharacterized protein DEU56DRAFT_919566 [Suillus clintonianus]KAG2114405.1 hypothetical protein DEU56DRAFT_919566 [Suillus clintonianus]
MEPTTDSSKSWCLGSALFVCARCCSNSGILYIPGGLLLLAVILSPSFPHANPTTTTNQSSPISSKASNCALSPAPLSQLALEQALQVSTSLQASQSLQVSAITITLPPSPASGDHRPRLPSSPMAPVSSASPISCPVVKCPRGATPIAKKAFQREGTYHCCPLPPKAISKHGPFGLLHF